jgi:hypothetical protein
MAAAERRRQLLISSRKGVLTDVPTDETEDCQWFSFGMKHLPDLPYHSTGLIGRFYDMSFVFFRDGRKPHVLPVSLLQNMSDEIVLMQALHIIEDGKSCSELWPQKRADPLAIDLILLRPIQKQLSKYPRYTH